MPSTRPFHLAVVHSSLRADREPFALTCVRSKIWRDFHFHSKFRLARHILAEEHVVDTGIPFPVRTSEFEEGFVRSPKLLFEVYLTCQGTAPL